MSKPLTLTPFSELVGYLPFIQSFKVKEIGVGDVLIDANGLCKADAIGSTIFFSNVAKIYNDKTKTNILIRDNKSILSIYSPSVILDFLRTGIKKQINLFEDDEYSNLKENNTLEGVIETGGVLINDNLEAMLYIPTNNILSRDISLLRIRKFIQNYFLLNVNYNFNSGQIYQVLIEIIKNSIDHSETPSVMAFSIEKNINGKHKFSFCHCEVGNGIVSNVRNFMGRSQNNILSRLSKKGAVTDFFHWAFTSRSSSKVGNGINFGLGLSTIISAAEGISMNLYLKDANSIIDMSGLPRNFSHTQIRQHQVTIAADHIPCFTYFGHVHSESI